VQDGPHSLESASLHPTDQSESTRGGAFLPIAHGQPPRDGSIRSTLARENSAHDASDEDPIDGTNSSESIARGAHAFPKDWICNKISRVRVLMTQMFVE